MLLIEFNNYSTIEITKACSGVESDYIFNKDVNNNYFDLNKISSDYYRFSFRALIKKFYFSQNKSLEIKIIRSGFFNVDILLYDELTKKVCRRENFTLNILEKSSTSTISTSVIEETTRSELSTSSFQNYSISSLKYTQTSMKEDDIFQSRGYTADVYTISPIEYINSLISSQIKDLNNITIFTSEAQDDQKLVMRILNNYTEDISGCLSNCSNNGICIYNYQNKFVCSCLSGYSGSACQANVKPCSKNQCLNNGTCSNKFNILKNNYEYRCLCSKYYYGDNCEHKVDVCKNVTCSNHGTCVDNSTLPICRCFNLYEGNVCEKESDKLKTIIIVISISSKIAIITIVTFYLLIILSDIQSIFFLQKKTNKKEKILNFKNKIIFMKKCLKNKEFIRM